MGSHVGSMEFIRPDDEESWNHNDAPSNDLWIYLHPEKSPMFVQAQPLASFKAQYLHVEIDSSRSTREGMVLADPSNLYISDIRVSNQSFFISSGLLSAVTPRIEIQLPPCNISQRITVIFENKDKLAMCRFKCWLSGLVVY